MRRLALVGLAALALLATACGAVEREPDLEPGDPDLGQAAEKTGSASFAFEVHFDAVMVQGGEREEHVCSGQDDDRRARSRLACDGGPRDGYEARQIGDTWYFRRSSEAMWHPTVDDVNVTFPVTSHVRGLALLQSVRGQIRRVGEEAIRGEPTVRYAVAVTCEQVDVPCAGTDVEVWIDGVGLVRRVQDTGPGSTYRVEYFDFGRPVDVQEPPPDEVQQPRYPLPVRCGSQRAGPITEGDAIAAFRRHGFDVVSLERWCSKGISAHIGTDSGTSPVILEGPGLVLCTLYAEGSSADVHEPLPEIVYLRALRVVDNLECLVSARGERAPARVSAFDAALAELPR